MFSVKTLKGVNEKMRLYFLTIWSILDPIYYSLTRLKYVIDESNHRHIFRVRLTRYKGRNVILSDGTIIQKNDLLIKIHLHNIRLLKDVYQLTSDIKKARYIYEQVKKGLPHLANYIQSHPKSEEIKGIIGITMLHKGCNRLGFETIPIQNKWYCMFKQIVFFPIQYLSSNHLRMDDMIRLPKYLFMSKSKLLKQYK
jgi:hypothetical protein